MQAAMDAQLHTPPCWLHVMLRHARCETAMCLVLALLVVVAKGHA
jgi:hypothetical protein